MATKKKAAPKAATSAVREMGYTVSTPGPFWAMLQTEKTPELRWPQSLQVFEDMLAQDGQVDATLKSITTPILRAGWRLDGAGCRPEVVAHVAKDLGLPVVGQDTDVPATRTRGRFSWTEHLQIAVQDHLQFGHAVFEQLYYLDPNDNLLHLRKLGFRPQRSIFAWDIASDGGLVSITQYARGFLAPAFGEWAGGGAVGATLPVSRLVVYVNEKRGGNWIGRSVLRSCYKNWLLKDRLLRIHAQSADRNGMGIPVYTAATDGDTEIEAGLEIASNIRAGDNSGVSIPKDAELELMGVTGQLIDPLNGVKYHDEQISRSMLANVLNLGQAKATGSWALGTTLMDILSLAIEAIAENVRDTATKHIIEDLVDVNYGPEEPAPRLVFDEIGSKNEQVIAAIASLVEAGVLQPDETLETFIRTTIGLPSRGGKILPPPATGAPKPPPQISVENDTSDPQEDS
ncbi:hypothetical protein Back2_17790 [Nocardioides baekrokdamisoli]|uniref:Portal protein n=1 Tax=Nocardioides baekrokdamisoli TaxID=1804624 RepID=A0A3G9IH21_9ACTN|nr:DUF935 family protein [Nocardioides baekrokdamisoli]BBH17492.1 hypothetical protein Back2_17790 [Nocardioides baekrokdamisoli]